MSNKELDFKKISETELRELYEKLLIEKHELEMNRIIIDRQNLKSKQRTIDLFGKMIDLKKAQKIITIQKKELERKNAEINRQKNALERTFQKFRQRTIELFGKMIDLKKAYNIIQQQKDEIEKQRKLLHETNASKDKFFSILAHDLKNPIGGFLGLTEVMADGMSDLSVEEQQNFAVLMHNSSKQVYSLLENLLHWARSQTGALQLKPKVLDLSDIIENVLNQAATNASLKQIQLKKNIPCSVKIFADEDTMSTIFRNLVSNAIKFSNDDSVVNITVTQNTHIATVSIADQGIGIAPEDIDKLFRIEHNPSRIGTAKEKGTGLGLILCKEFVEKNGGTIKVESELNKGSVFTITVPLAEKNVQQKLE